MSFVKLQRTDGIRYASDLPTPVQASIIRCSRPLNARVTARSMSSWPGRDSYPLEMAGCRFHVELRAVLVRRQAALRSARLHVRNEVCPFRIVHEERYLSAPVCHLVHLTEIIPFFIVSNYDRNIGKRVRPVFQCSKGPFVDLAPRFPSSSLRKRHDTSCSSQSQADPQEAGCPSADWPSIA